LRLFLDSAERAHWDEWLPSGLFYGITTNPILLEKAGLPCDMPVVAGLVRAAFSFEIEELHVQTWGVTAEAMLARGREIAALDPRIVIKVPVTREGAAIAQALSAAGTPVTLTALYAPFQALIAALARSQYAAPYFGRIADSGRDAYADIAAMKAILSGLEAPVRLLVASIRTAAEIGTLAATGLDTFTIGAHVASELFSDPQTAAAAADFERAAGSSSHLARETDA
jgi:transaldolase